MRKKVLLAEQSGSTRSVIETILRQTGFEVVSVSDHNRAVEVLGLSKPDIMIIGSDLTGAGDKPLYSYLNENEIYNSIPILLLASADDKDLPYPDEVIIRRPFDTKELLEKIKIFVGQDTSQQQITNSSPNPLGTMDLNDEFLDAALGIDNISVIDSEVMDKTGSIPVVKSDSKKATDIGDLDEFEDNSKIESIIIDDDQTDIRRPATKKTKMVQPNASGKLDILQDQYGISKEAQKKVELEDSAHDYHWFVNEMQSDSKPQSGPASTPPKDNSNLEAVNLKEVMQPVTAEHVKESDTGKAKHQEKGVEKFIDDFKKEMEKIDSDNKTETVTIKDDNNQSNASTNTKPSKQNVQSATDPLEIFTRQFTTELAAKLAKVIADKIDSEKLLNLIRNEILTEIKKNNS